MKTSESKLIGNSADAILASCQDCERKMPREMIAQAPATGQFGQIAHRRRLAAKRALVFLCCLLTLSAAHAQSEDFQRLMQSSIQAEKRGDWRQAIELCHQILKVKPGDVETMVSLSGLYGHAGNPAQQIAWSQKVLVIQPRTFKALINRGNGYSAIGEGRPAIDSYRAAEAIDPTSPIPAYSLGVVAQAQGHEAAAAGYFHKALQLSPGFEDARFNLAVSLANQGEAAQAIRVLDQLLRQNPLASDAIQLSRALRSQVRP